ncbi:MAG: hypothetical protein J6C55_04280 [Oscillospiraceae bacterium]|nr:hypothetical protein [Oscillospiraceae bacterium]
MINNFKKIFFDFIFSLIIVFSIIFCSKFVADNFNNNNFFVNHILEIKSEDNILNKVILLLKKDSSELIKKYIEAVVDSFIEFDKLPSVDDIKYFFELIINNSKNNLKIQNIKIYNNKMIITCKFKDLDSLKNFIKNIKIQNTSGNIIYYKYNKLKNIYIIKIYFIRK